ncbi:ribosomal RNA small subunit methyltransferase E [Spirochaetia bacterium]|nr:ribosomal RNA small subunit methyltransferase E [Spirochaetia bacterium]
MKQFLLQTEPHKGIVTLEGRDYRYLVLVRRMKEGHVFDVCLPDGTLERALVKKIDKKSLVICILPKSDGDGSGDFSGSGSHIGDGSDDGDDGGSRLNAPSSTISHKLILMQSMPKGAKLDVIVRQATEVGIAKVIPFYSKYSLPQETKQETQLENTPSKRTQRLQRIIKEARQQSGSRVMTEIREAVNTEGIIEYWNGIKEDSIGLLIYEEESCKASGNSLLEIMRLLNSKKSKVNSESSKINSENSKIKNENYSENAIKKIVFVVGPEGGFSKEEASLFLENGFKAISLGPNILRVETAAVYAAALIQTLCHISPAANVEHFPDSTSI